MGQKFGQHFLASSAILDKIARLVCGSARPRVLEIGPGRGALTEKLLACTSYLTAVEIDYELVTYLQSRFASVPNFTLVNADALEVDLTAANPDIIAGNLPYSVATPLIERTIRLGLPAVFLIQKEVALRLVAIPGTRDYGFLTVQTQLFSHPVLSFSVPPGAFKPPPKVDSAVVTLTPRNGAAEFGIDDTDAFLHFVSACFRQKRKMLRNNLRADYPIDGHPEAQLRAEQLSIKDLAGLWIRLRS